MINEEIKVNEVEAGKPAPAYLKRKRPILITLLALLSFLSCLGGLAATLFTDLLFNYGVSYGSDLPRISYTRPADLGGVNPLGVNTALNLETSPEDIDRDLDLIKAGGYGFIRQSFPWESIEPQKGQFEWSKFDQIVEKARARNIQIIARLDRPPYWARPKEFDRLKDARPRDFLNLTGPPENPVDFATFAARVASHYKGKLKFFQVWNEPNLAAEWNDRRVSPAEYVTLLKETYTSLKQASSEAIVISAPLSPTTEDGPEFNNLDDLKFLSEMYREGARPYFDILAIQLYGLGYPPDFRYLQPDPRSKNFKRVNFNRAAASHEIMVQNGDKTKPVWATEYGWISVPPGPFQEDYNNPQKWNKQWGENISEEDQAAYLVEGLQRARKEWPWLGVVNVWFFRPDPPLAATPANPTNYFALVKPDFSPRPAYFALQKYARQEIPFAGTGWTPAKDPSVNYSAIPFTLAGNFTFSFKGERADLVLKPEREGVLRVTLDGSASKEIPLKAGGETRLTLAENLKFGQHKLEVTPVMAGNGPSGIISGFFVSNENHFNWLLLLLYPTLGLGTLLSFTALVQKFLGGIIWGFPRLSRFLFKGISQSARWLWLNPEIYAPLVLGFCLLIFYFGPPNLAFPGLVLFFIFSLIRPDWAVLFAIIFSPLYLHPRDLRLTQSWLETLSGLLAPRDPNDNRPRLEFSLTEVSVVLATGAWFTRNLINFVSFRLGGFQTFKSFPQGLSPRTLIFPASLKTWRSKFTSLFPPLLTLFLVAALSLLTPDPTHLKEALREFRLVILEPLIVFLLVLRFIKGRAGVWKVLDLLIGVGVVVALLGIWQYFLGKDKTVSAEGVSRVISIYNHPDNLGLFLGRIIPVATSYTFWGSGWNWRRKYYSASLVILLGALLLAFSRGAILGTAAAFLVLVIIFRSRRGLIAFGAGLALLLAALPFIKLERVSSIFSLVTGSNQTRIHVWKAALQMIKDNPISGIGLDQFLYKYRVEYVAPEAWLERYTNHPHNLFLDYWLRLGIMGPIILFWLLFAFFWSGFYCLAATGIKFARLRKEPSGPGPDGKVKSLGERKVLLAGLVGSMVDFVVHGLVDNSFFLQDLALIFCLSFALLEILRRETLAEEEIGL